MSTEYKLEHMLCALTYHLNNINSNQFAYYISSLLVLIEDCLHEGKDWLRTKVISNTAEQRGQAKAQKLKTAAGLHRARISKA